jgi:prepilin-type N-terminal cleavage/methylation domain-containing protein
MAEQKRKSTANSDTRYWILDTRRASRIGNRETRRGFTLVETVVASAILCGTVLVVGAISTRAVSGTRLNRQYEMAALVADRQLRLIDYVGIDSFIESGQMEGVFEQFEPVYYWKVATEYQDIDSLYLVTITVSWMDGNRPYSITVDTMLDGISVSTTSSTGTVTTSTVSTGTATE